MLLSAGCAPPQSVGARPFLGNAPLRIWIWPTHVRRMNQFHPTPQAPLTPGCNRKWPQLGGSIQCHGDAADEAQPFSRTAKSPITGGLERVSIQPVK